MSVVPLLLGDSDSLSVSYGMEPEQERLFKLYSGSGIHSLPELNPKKSHVKTPAPYKLSKQRIRRYILTSDSNKVIKEFQ